MDITTLSSISSDYLDSYAKSLQLTPAEDDSFSTVLSAAMGALNETNDLVNKEKEEIIRFALGQSENTHDLLIAEAKAAVAMQYTVAVKDGIVDAYKELMQMQI